jgi:transposase
VSTGRALAQRLVGDGEQVLDVPAKLAARVRVLSVGHGRKSDPHDAVSVAVAARSAPQLRQVGAEDQAVVLHLLTKRRQDLVAARPQTIMHPASGPARVGEARLSRGCGQ